MKLREEILKEALAAALLHKRCSIVLAMGTGKTNLGLQYINHFGHKTRALIVAPKLSIFQTWKDEAVKWKLGHIQADFTTYLSLDKQSLDYDILILDEMHNLKPNKMQWLKAFKGRILGLSGTAPRPDSEKGIMVDAFCPVVYSYSVDSAVDDEILNDYRIIVHKLELSRVKDLLVTAGKKQWLSSEWENYNYWTNRIAEANSPKGRQITRVMRMRALMDYKTKEIYAKKLFDGITDKVILFGNTQAQVDRMCEHTVHSKNMESDLNLQLFKLGQIRKLGCVQMLSEGINISDLKEAVIMHTFSGSSPKSPQKLGRCLRLNSNETAIVHMLTYAGTADAKWTSEILAQFDSSKITYTKTP